MATQVRQRNRRRVPRRSFDTYIGALFKGKYVMGRSSQVGEGGMMITVPMKLVIGDQVVVSFVLNLGSLIVVRGVVRSLVPSDGGPQRYGLEFVNLGFQYKREIRNFVAAATRMDGHI